MDIYKNAILIFLFDIIVKAKAFITIPLLIHRYGAADYGVWTQIMVLGKMVVPFVILGTDMAFQRYLSGVQQVEQVHIFWGWIKAQVFIGLCLSCLVTPAFFIFKNNFLSIYSSEEVLIIVCLVMFSSVISNTIRSFYNVQGEIKSLGVFNSAQALLFVLVVLLGFNFQIQLLNLLACVIFSDLLVSAIMLTRIFLRYGCIPGPNSSFLRKFLIFGLPLVPAQLLMLGMNYADRLILPSYVGFDEIGKYALAYQAGSLLLQFLLAPFWVLFPSRLAELVNKGNVAGATNLYSKSTEALFFIVAPTAVSLIALGSSLLSLYAGLIFTQSALIMVCVGIGYYFHLLASFNEVLLGVHLKQKFTVLSYGLGLAVNLAANFLLIPSFGISGAAIATFLGFLTQYLTTLIMARLYWGNLGFQGVFYLKIIMMVLALYFLYRFIYLFELPDAIGTPIALALGIIFYLALALSLKLFSLQQLRGLINVSK